MKHIMTFSFDFETAQSILHAKKNGYKNKSRFVEEAVKEFLVKRSNEFIQKDSIASKEVRE